LGRKIKAKIINYRYSYRFVCNIICRILILSSKTKTGNPPFSGFPDINLILAIR